MLDDYKLEQPKVYRILKNAVIKNHISHAYLLEANGYKNKTLLAIAFAKMLLCPNNYSNNEKCVNCTQCTNIDKNIFSELKIIDVDGLWIKKEALDELQKEFSKTSISANKRVYIINNVDRLNRASANSILKFLEEPEKNIIAILVTDNIHQLLDTIVSRCQIISLNKMENSQISCLENLKNNVKIPLGNKYTDEYLNELIDNSINFIEYFEKNGLDTILKTNKLWHNIFSEKDEVLFALNTIILFYKDMLNFKLGRKLEIFKDYINKIENLNINNTISILYKKINVIIETKDKVNFNTNASLLIDKMILELERCD